MTPEQYVEMLARIDAMNARLDQLNRALLEFSTVAFQIVGPGGHAVAGELLRTEEERPRPTPMDQHRTFADTVRRGRSGGIQEGLTR